EIEKDYHNLSQKVGFSDLEKYGLEIPEIYNPLRWWRKDVLADLLVLKEVINKKQMSQKYSDFFNLALVSALVPDLTNVTLGRLQLHFIDRSEDEINVLHTFKERVQTMINDLKTVQENNLKKTSHLIQQDSTQITENIFESKVDHV